MTPPEVTAEESDASEDQPRDEHPETGASVGTVRRWTRSLAVGGAVLLAVAVVAVALLARSGEKMREGSRIPAYDVTYTVTGTAPVSVSVSGGDGMTLRGGELAPSELPWTKRVSMPADGTPPTMEILLDEKGGRAECALSVHDRLVSRSVAEGVFGRATCGATAPTTAPPASPAT